MEQLNKQKSPHRSATYQPIEGYSTAQYAHLLPHIYYVKSSLQLDVNSWKGYNINGSYR